MDQLRAATDLPAQAARSAGAAARRLGVAVGTLRSWDRRYGLGPRVHQPGAHRRYSPADMLRLESLCRLVGEGVAVAEAARAVLAGAAEPPACDHTASPAPVDTPAPPAHGGGGGRGLTLPIGRRGGSAARGLARSAIRLDAPRVLELLEAAIARDGVVGAWQQTIEPTLRAVGRKWTEISGRHVEVEHLLSWCVTVALHRVRPATAGLARPAARGVVLACTPDEWHSLPLEVLAAALAQRAVPTRMLGAAVPHDALVEAVRRTGPASAVVWSHTARTADETALARLAELSGIQVLAAGPGWAGHVPTGVRTLMNLPEAVDACGYPGPAIRNVAPANRPGSR